MFIAGLGELLCRRHRVVRIIRRRYIVNSWLPDKLPLVSCAAVAITFIAIGLFFTKIAEMGGSDMGVWNVVIAGLVIIAVVPAIGYVLSRRNVT